MKKQNPIVRALGGIKKHLSLTPTPGLKEQIIPKLQNPILLGAAAIGASASAAVIRLRANAKENQCEKIQHGLSEIPGIEKSAVQLKQSLASPRLVVKIQAEENSELLEIAQAALKISWDQNPAGPTSIDLRVREKGEEKTEVTVRELGFSTPIAYPHELYEYFGAPATDPAWKP
ncbi:hypothetical protein KRX54_01865 [Actinomycetaceae bacterium TAE3-ERU4]|nr:hypothetical protein [Actinomycetaceae bacterium TAE3-ERU4]